MGMGRARELGGQRTTAAFEGAVPGSSYRAVAAVRGGAARLGDTLGVMRRRLAVTAAVLAALVGEWLGHSLSYFRVAGLAGLQAGLTAGVHEYMAPLGIALLFAAAAGATMWARAWMALGRRLDSSAAAIRRLRRGQPGGSPVGNEGAAHWGASPRTPAPSWAARVLALAAPMAALQCVLYLLQENLERALHGLPVGSLAPLLDAHGAAAWIQVAVALVMATVLVAAMRLRRTRAAAAALYERIVRALWRRAFRAVGSPPQSADVIPVHLLLRHALWGRPPPVTASA
jgi:hypothetical protein